MANKKQPKSNQACDRDSKIEKPSSFLETQRSHKDWYDRNAGKMRGKPTAVPRETRKSKGSRKHSLRKEK